MPVRHDYICDRCGREVLDHSHAIEAPDLDCPDCGERMTRRIPAGTDFVLVGSRWARDGYSGDGG